MYLKTKYPEYDKITVTCNCAGLARSHKMIRAQNEKEAHFMRLCSQIKLDDFKTNRADKQREDRRQKRHNKYSEITID